MVELKNSNRDKLPSNDIRVMFDRFLIKFEQMEKSRATTTDMFLDAVEDTVDTVLPILPYKLLVPNLLHHPLMYYLHQAFITMLDSWSVTRLCKNIQEADIFLKIGLIFVHAAEEATVLTTNEDRKGTQDLLTTKELLFEVREQTDDIVLNKQDFNGVPNMFPLGLLTIKLLQGRPFHYNLGRNDRLIGHLVLSCLYSYDYVEIMYQLQRDEPLTDIDRYLLLTCWQFLSSATLIKQDSPAHITSIDLIYHLSDTQLKRLEHAFDKLSSITPSSLAEILKRCNHFLKVYNLPSFDKHAHYIINHLTNILRESSPIDTNTEVLVIVVLEAFYKLSKNANIRALMRRRHITSLFEKYTSIKMGIKRQLAFAILSEIMNEEQINNNLNELPAVFVDELKQINPHKYDLYDDTALSSLKVLVQHEQIKNEFIKQGGLETVVSFISDGDPNKQSDEQLSDALNILRFCTFNSPQVLNRLKRDANLIIQVNRLSKKGKENNNKTLEKAAEVFIWKVEKEQKFKEQQAERIKQKAQGNDTEEEAEQYDLMISYAWEDMNLAHRIFKHLTEKLGYKIWLDQQQMHGSTIEAMANAVDNAQFILMCMSETYKRSANCQSEAEYAFNRKKNIVPCKTKKGYKPDGWLGFILGTRMYIDFGKHQFEKAIEQLHHQIQLQKKKRAEEKPVVKVEKKDEADIKNTVKEQSHHDTTEEQVDVGTIASWNTVTVRKFLTRKDLLDLLPLCDGINGAELLYLYRMCTSSSVSMYYSFKLELTKVHDKFLPISTYLRFINCLQGVDDAGLQLKPYMLSEDLEELSEVDE